MLENNKSYDDALVGIIIPAYNVENYIARAIESCIKQTYNNIEILVVDDGSIDGTYKIAKNYEKKDNRVHVFRQENHGVSTARNYAMNMSRSQYVVFLDSDDWIEIDTIEKLVKHLPGSNDGCLVCADAYYAYFKNNRIVKEKAPYMAEDVILESKDAILFISEQQYKLRSACYKLFSMKIIREKKLHFYSEIRHGEDGLFVFEYLKCVEKFVYFPDPLWNILERQGSATKSPYNKYWLTSLDAIDKMQEYDNSEILSKVLRNYRVQRTVAVLCEASICTSDNLEDIKLLRKNLRRNSVKYIREEKNNKKKLFFLFATFFPIKILSLYCKRKA